MGLIEKHENVKQQMLERAGGVVGSRETSLELVEEMVKFDIPLHYVLVSAGTCELACNCLPNRSVKLGKHGNAAVDKLF